MKSWVPISLTPWLISRDSSFFLVFQRNILNVSAIFGAISATLFSVSLPSPSPCLFPLFSVPPSLPPSLSPPSLSPSLRFCSSVSLFLWLSLYHFLSLSASLSVCLPLSIFLSVCLAVHSRVHLCHLSDHSIFSIPFMQNNQKSEHTWDLSFTRSIFLPA